LGQSSCECLAQQIDTFAAIGAHRHHGHTESPRKLFHIDLNAAALRSVDHVERHHDRHAKVEQLREQVEIAIEIGGVQHGDNGVERALLVHAPEHRIDRDRFIGGARRKAVGSGKIDQFCFALSELENATSALDRHPGVVAHFVRQTGERVEQSGLAGIGVADDRNRGHRAVDQQNTTS
jgi:hypothetical protein